ncbi:MAG: hypothetical protein FGF53_08420 [Candidatus Brockarchaeota archaeon]|nr:hypothetical protein [Candidatus Brockarchaeota archaeon]
MLGHLTRLFSAIIIGLLFSYFVYRALASLDGFLASILFLGFMLTTPITLILVFYNRLRWGMLFFTAVWLLYASAIWLYMLADFFTKVFNSTSRPSAYVHHDIVKNNAIPEYLSEYANYPNILI